MYNFLQTLDAFAEKETFSQILLKVKPYFLGVVRYLISRIQSPLTFCWLKLESPNFWIIIYALELKGTEQTPLLGSKRKYSRVLKLFGELHFYNK